MKRKLFLFLFLLSFAGVSAVIIYSGSAYGIIEFVKNIDFGPMALQEENEVVIGFVNSTITEELILNTKCDSGIGTHIAKIKNPLGSTIPSVNLNLNGNTTINAVNNTLESGNIRLYIKTVKQGTWNCTIRVFNTTSTQVKFVDEI